MIDWFLLTLAAGLIAWAIWELATYANKIPLSKHPGQVVSRDKFLELMEPALKETFAMEIPGSEWKHLFEQGENDLITEIAEIDPEHEAKILASEKLYLAEQKAKQQTEALDVLFPIIAARNDSEARCIEHIRASVRTILRDSGSFEADNHYPKVMPAAAPLDSPPSSPWLKYTNTDWHIQEPHTEPMYFALAGKDRVSGPYPDMYWANLVSPPSLKKGRAVVPQLGFDSSIDVRGICP